MTTMKQTIKKILMGCLVTVMAVSATSCSKEGNNNPLAGTQWVETGGDYLIMTFSSGNSVDAYFGGYSKGTSGTYSVSGSQIRFQGLKIQPNNLTTIEIKKGTFSNTVMNLSGECENAGNTWDESWSLVRD